MTTITIPSPGGHVVEVAGIETFLEKYPDTSRKSYSYLAGKLPILKALWYGGSFENSSGRSTIDLHAKAVEFGFKGKPASINLHAHTFESLGVISRELNSRRCFRYTLLTLPDIWYNAITADEPELEDLLETYKDPNLDYDEQRVEPVETEVVAPDVTAQVAAALLQQCVDIINSGGNINDDEVAAALQKDVHALELRLGDQVACYQTASRKLKETQDELFAVKDERDALRKTVRRLEQNVEAFKNPAIETYIRDRVTSEVNKTMRESPRSH